MMEEKSISRSQLRLDQFEFPEDLGYVECVGFDDACLEYLVNAFEYGGAIPCKSGFKFLGNIYHVEYDYDRIVSKVTKAGKVEVDEDGNDVDFIWTTPEPLNLKPKSKIYESWGDM